ncbi:MAG: GNAT family N-acetyltransferase [Candidatus Nanopelagicales bacterium]
MRTTSSLAAAWDDARRAAERSGVEVRALSTLDELADARAVWDAVWPTVPGATEITGNLIRAIEHAGGYVSGAYAGGRMVGSCLAFLGRSREDAGWHTHLHSHIAAATPGNADRGIGTALKLHQRAWALEHDIDRVVWTFDPLVRRNARLNLVKLGAVASEYLVDFYGVMDDALNVGEPSDRLLAQWDVGSERVAAALAGAVPLETHDELLARGAEAALVVGDEGEPHVVPTSARTTLVALPGDIIDIRRRDGGLARAWRLAVRQALAPVGAGEAQVVGLTSDGWYVVEEDA